MAMVMTLNTGEKGVCANSKLLTEVAGNGVI